MSGLPKHLQEYELIGKIPVDDGSIKFQVSNLSKHCEIQINSIGITVCLDRYGENNGIIHGRIIHDFIGTISIFRKDQEETTYFKVLFEHQ